MDIIQTMKELLNDGDTQGTQIELRVLETYLKGLQLGYAQGMKTERDGKLG